ncbi:MAG TPA: GspE/PulE family protein [Caldimonas sp.]|jgi:general secretion pathway protein E|nr:GspE/PulE family protein [Caldimonas sp.]
MNRPPSEELDSVAARSLDASLVRQAQLSAGPLPILEWLAKEMGLTEDTVLPAAASHFGLQPMSMTRLRKLKPDYTLASFAECKRQVCLLSAVDDEMHLTVVISDPVDARLRRWLEIRTQGRSVTFGLATRANLLALLAGAEKDVRAMDAVRLQQGRAQATETAISISIAHIDATESPVVRLVDSTLYDALRSGASDIHLETQPNGMVIKYRLDGVLEVVKEIDDIETAHQAISRIKVVSELDIAERRVPQDGRFQVVVDGREIDFRVSIMPNLFGEDAVLRVLDRKHLTGQFKALTLDTLGFDAGVLQFIRDAARMPYGLLLVTGPTGSGKTTTLYAALSEINTGLDKIVTIEDPIEYQLPGVLQIPVNEKKGLNFARGLRSILRHDPDKIMVGEIRDAETAQIGVQAALTGHQVFTTVHANNVFDVIGRFANMGVDSYSLVAALNGIVAQRLLRMSCPQCAVDYQPSAEVLARSGIKPVDFDLSQFKRGLGCAHCRGTGYKGRRAVAETLPMTDVLRDQLVQRAPLSQIRQAARERGFTSLRDAAVRLACDGSTTLEEINRVTPVE